MSKLTKYQFDAIKVTDKVKNSKTNKFEAVKEKHEKVLVLESGYVVEQSDLRADDLQAVTPIAKPTVLTVKKPTPPSAEAVAYGKLISEFPEHEAEIFKRSKDGESISDIGASILMAEAGSKARR